MSTDNAAQPAPRSTEQVHDLSSRSPGAVEEDLLRLLRSIQFGSVEVTIHDSRVVQIERREKLRFDGATKLRRGC